jgi:hypothetical protein
MISSPEEKILYSDIQKKLFYIVPEKWESIYLYASVIDMPRQKPVGEMYFYYLPKGIIKKKYVNGYEIPNLFNIDEEQYSKLITDVYNLIKLLRERFIKAKRKVWSNVSISIENFQFKIEYDYENLRESEFDSYERHVIWRYNYLKEGTDALSKKDKKIIERYKNKISLVPPLKKDVYIEGVYKQPVKNIIDYEKTLSVEEAIAQSKTEAPKEKKKSVFFKKNKIDDIIQEEEEEVTYNNQILNWKK